MSWELFKYTTPETLLLPQLLTDNEMKSMDYNLQRKR